MVFWLSDFQCQFLSLVVEPVKIASLIKSLENFARKVEQTTEIFFWKTPTFSEDRMLIGRPIVTIEQIDNERTFLWAFGKLC